MRLLRVSLAALLIQPVPGVAATSRPDPMRVGILPVAESASPRVTRAVGIAERRVQRWVENLRTMPVRVEPIAPEPSAVETSETAVILQDPSRWAGLKRSPERESSISGLDGPLLQQALLVEAIAAYAEKREGDARNWLSRAFASHPAARLSGIDFWDREAPGFDLAGFEALVDKVGGGFLPQCRVDLQVEPPSALVFVNGFRWSEKSITVLPQKALRIRAEAVGRRAETRELSCLKAGTTKLALSLVPGDEVRSAEQLSALARRGKFESLFLIEAAGEELKLFFFTPTQELKEVPMAAPLRIADLLQDPVGTPLPIRTDAFLEVWKSALARSLTLAPPTSSTLSLEAPRKREWYNNPTFWIIAGGLVGGAVLTYVLTREAPVRSQTGVTFQLDRSP